MPLTWNLSSIKDYKTVCYRPIMRDLGDGPLPAPEEYGLNPVTHALIFLMMFIGFNEITEKNKSKVWARTRAWEANIGAMLNNGSGNPSYLTEEDVSRHVGLKTNTNNTTKAAFKKSLLEAIWRRAVPPAVEREM